MSLIIFNGKKYNSIDEMPANERQAFQQLTNIFVDKNGNGIPDFLEGDMVQNVTTAFGTSFNYSGQTYGNLNELPPDVREKVQDAFEKLADVGIVSATSLNLDNRAFTQVGQETARSSEPMISREFSPTIQEDRGTPSRWIIIGFVLAIALGAALLGLLLAPR